MRYPFLIAALLMLIFGFHGFTQTLPTLPHNVEFTWRASSAYGITSYINVVKHGDDIRIEKRMFPFHPYEPDNEEFRSKYHLHWVMPVKQFTELWETVEREIFPLQCSESNNYFMIKWDGREKTIGRCLERELHEAPSQHVCPGGTVLGGHAGWLFSYFESKNATEEKFNPVTAEEYLRTVFENAPDFIQREIAGDLIELLGDVPAELLKHPNPLVRQRANEMQEFYLNKKTGYPDHSIRVTPTDTSKTK